MKMKKAVALILALVLVFALVGCGKTEAPAASTNTTPAASTDTAKTDAPKAEEPAKTEDKVVELTYANFLASGNPYEVIFNYVFTEAYNRSNGTVKITYYPGGTILGQADMLDGIINGVADMGYVQPADNKSAFPEISMIEQPGLYFASSPAINNALMEYIATYQPAELSEIKVLSCTGGTKGAICQNGNPVHVPSDLAGKTIRATGTMAKAVTAFGASPSDIAIADCYESIRQGVVDGIMTLRGAVYTWNLTEVLDYGMDYPLYNNTGFFIMNLDVWNSLSENQQNAIQSAFDDAFEVCTQFFSNDFYKEPDAQRLKTELKEYYYPTDEEVEQWRVLVEDGVTQYVEELNSKGVNGDEIYQRWLDLAAKWNAEYPAKSDDDPDMWIATNPSTGERLQCGPGTGFEWTLPY